MVNHQSSNTPVFDVNCQYVRLRARRADGYVEFDFAIGDPALAVELTLPAAAYDTFCRERRVLHLTPAEAAAVDHERSKWQFGTPGHQD
ncbi:MAG: hypothetical protein RL434_842 [Pseudomonadota bacterium]|jgi:phenol hydroxylase P0 protein